MPEINPPQYLRDGCYTAQQDRLMWSALICEEGVKDRTAGDFQVIATGAAKTISVRAGSAFVQGDDIANQGLYLVTSDSLVTLTFADADPTDARIDLVVARVYDSQYTGTLDEWRLEIVKGSPSPAPVAPEVPNSALVLASIRVTPAQITTPLPQSQITDLRQDYHLCADRRPELWFGSLFGQTTVLPSTVINVPWSQRPMPGSVSPVTISGANLFTVQRAGLYRLQCQLTYPATAGTGYCQTRLYLNGGLTGFVELPLTGNAVTVRYERTVLLEVGNTIRFSAYQNTGYQSLLRQDYDLTRCEIERISD